MNNYHPISKKPLKNNINLGINILRMILSFWVLSFHCAGIEIKRKYKILNTFFHVPTFMIMSFYYSYNIFHNQNINKLKLRIERLLIPFIFIPIVFLLIRNIFFHYKITFKNIFNQILRELILQYLTGYKFYVLLWFIHILIVFSIFFFILFHFFQHHIMLILQITLLFSYYLQYSEINYNIFNSYSLHLRAGSHLIEMLPIAITGLTLAHLNIQTIFNNHRIKFMLYFIAILLFIYNYNVFGVFKGFFYSGIKNNIASICLFISFSLIPLDKLKNKYIIYTIKQITSYTGGIYYYHPMVGMILEKFTGLNNGRMFFCFVIYVNTYIICLIGTKIFRNNKIKYLFN